MASSIFSGSSRYAADFAQVIERSVAIASLPITQLQNQRDRLSTQSTALASLAKSVSSLRSAVKAVDEARTALSVSSSDGTVLSASAELTSPAGTYSIDVVSTGSRSAAFSADSLPKVSDYSTQNISTAASFTLTVDATSYEITPAGNNLGALAASINEERASGVQAVIVNLGSGDSPDYRISLQSTRLGPVNMQLAEANANPQDLLIQGTHGTLASYRINGQPSGSPITSATASQIAIAPGLKVDLLKAGASEIVVKSDGNKLSSALSGLAAAYNSLVTEIDQSRGQSNGALSAQGIISSVTHSLRRFTAFTSSGQVASLTDLGFTFSDKGVLSFSAAKFEALASQDRSDFLGSTTEGGLLAVATEVLNMMEADSTGLLPTSVSSIKNQIAETDRQITANQERIDLLRQRLAEQMAASDALIGSLEQQVSYMNSLFEAMRVNAQS